jgi:cyclomaltodextrinase
MDITTPDWVKDAVFYQIFPDRFAYSERLPKPANLQPWGAPPSPTYFQGGDLLGVVEKLDYLVDLGINAIYLNPVFASAANHRYHTHDYYQVDPLLGGNEALFELLEQAHRRGVRVILDGVFNHASRGFFQFHHLMENGPDSPYLGWFNVHGWPINAYDYQEEPNYDAWWRLRALPEFNTNLPAVREYLWDVATYWLHKGIDGWRLDVPGEIDDDEFWREFRRRCKAINPEAYLVGEFWEEVSRWLQGDTFDAQMNYLFTRAALSFFGGRQLDAAEAARCGYGALRPISGQKFAAALDYLHNHIYHPEIVQAQMTMLGSHDTPRLLTLVGDDPGLVRLLFLCQMTTAGAPTIYYGDEIGLAGGHDPECRRAFPWHDPAAWNHALHSYVRHLIALRQATPALRRGDFTIRHASNQVILYQRQYEGQLALIALNMGKRSHTIPAGDLAGITAPLQEQLAGDGSWLQAGRDLTLPARSGRLWVST